MDTALITGASRGIGLKLVEHFLAKGLAVIATYRGEPSESLATLAQSDDVKLHPLEVTDESAVAALGETLSTQTVDILVNNAGVIGPEAQARDALSSDAWLETFAINTLSPLRVSHALLPSLRRASNPRIVTVSSQMGSMVHGGAGLYAYRSSKAALNKVMHILSQELAEDGITVCPIHPGWVRTDMGGETADISPDESAAGIVELACGLTFDKTGTFYTWDGRVHPW